MTYTYDDFNRLQTAETEVNHWGALYGYDRYGNLLSRTRTKGSISEWTRAVSTATNRVNWWSHDAAGNVTAIGTTGYVYDANNQVTRANVNGNVTQYKYDAAGSRVMKVTASETIYYVFGVGEFSSVTGWRKLYVHLGREKLIEYSNGTTYFYHADHLGTPRVQTDMSGSVVETWDSYPFGEQWLRSGINNNEHRYTGHLRDPETGNEYAGARYYSGPRGRWLSVDPVLGDISNPQRLNRYSYVGNDPVNYYDSDGTEWQFVGCVPETKPNEEGSQQETGYRLCTWRWVASSQPARGAAGARVDLRQFREERPPTKQDRILAAMEFLTSVHAERLSDLLSEGLGSGCRSFFSNKHQFGGLDNDLAAMQARVGKLRFWDVASELIAHAPASMTGYPDTEFKYRTIKGLLGGAYARTWNNSIIVGQLFWRLPEHTISPGQRSQDSVLIEELLHAMFFPSLTHSSIADYLGVTYSNEEDAAKQIQEFLTHDCTGETP